MYRTGNYIQYLVITYIGKEFEKYIELKDKENIACETLWNAEKVLLMGVEKRDPSYTVGGNVNWYSNYGEQYGGSSKKLKIELPYDPAIPLLGIYLEKTIIQKDTCTVMFVMALFTIAKTWKQPKCPSTDEWIKKMWYIYTMEYYSAIKQNETLPFATTWMDLEGIMLREINGQRKTNTS